LYSISVCHTFAAVNLKRKKIRKKHLLLIVQYRNTDLQAHPMKLFVFRTNLKNESQKEIIEEALSQLKGIYRWSIDMNDRNKALRIQCHGLKDKEIQSLICNAGIDCKKMY